MLEPIQELKHLVSITKENYQLLYSDLLKSLEPSESSFKLVIAVLKHRRAYMLSIGANAETCYQQQDAWTYALFTATLLRDEKPDQIKVSLPQKGLQWLQRFQGLYEDWCDFLNHEANTNNIIATIIKKAEAVLLNKPIAPTELTIDNQFIAWLKQALTNENIKVNQIDNEEHGAAHVTPNGILLVMPELWEKFLMANPTITEDWQALTVNNSYFIKNTDETYLHAFCIGDWQQRKVIKGLLLKPHLLFEPDKLPAINNQLSPDLMSAV